MKTYLVTGGCGFIGSNYIRYMFQTYGKNVRIVNADKLTYAGNPENLRDIERLENYVFVQADICGREAMRELFQTYEVDRVVHFAAESHVDRSIAGVEIFVKTNVLGTLSLLDAAKEAWESGDGKYLPDKKFLYVSTDEVYGSLGEKDEPFTETTPYAPRSPYAASKASADMLVKAYIDTYRFPANITNCSNNYGPYQFPEKLIPLAVSRVLKGEKIPVYGDGRNIRDWLYVEDHARALDLIQEKGALYEKYNIGGGCEKRNLEIVRAIQKAIGKLRPGCRAEVEYVEDRKGHDWRYAVNFDKLAKLGWKPEVSFEEGMEKTVLWYLENQEWLEGKNK